MPKTVKVFISSTFKDMDAEREALMKGVFLRVQAEASSMDLNVRAVDLRWGVLTADASMDAIREALEGCPFYICVLGERYGWASADAGEKSVL